MEGFEDIGGGPAVRGFSAIGGAPEPLYGGGPPLADVYGRSGELAPLLIGDPGPLVNDPCEVRAFCSK